MRKILLLILLVPLIALAQSGNTSEKGIKWSKGLTWEEIKQKAKQENKYIFIDCFTTWCGPCKMMDNQVFPNDSVGNYFNKKFISVKVQMDKTEKDSEEVKNWYDNADKMNKEYKIEGFPSFIFLSPEGIIVGKAIGYIGPKDFLTLARSVTAPGKVYDDPYKEYDSLLAAYDKGIKSHDKYPFMINMAIKYNDHGTAIKLLKELTDSVSLLPREKRYTKDIIPLWSQYTLRTDKPVFQFFYNDGDLIDKVMNHSGYAASVVDRSIQAEIVAPFFVEASKGSGISMSGMYLSGPGVKTDYSEADWKKLEKIITAKFSPVVAKRNVLTARIEWYLRHWNYTFAAKFALELLNSFPPDIKSASEIFKVNMYAFYAFLYSTDQEIIGGYIKWMQMVVENHPNMYSYIDTYANLLYKSGKKEIAIQWQEKAAKMAPGDMRFINTLKEMKEGKPTYLEEGSVWK